MNYRIMRYTFGKAFPKVREGESYGTYEWMVDTYADNGEAALTGWFERNSPVPPGYYVAVPWDQVNLPKQATVEPERMVFS